MVGSNFYCMSPIDHSFKLFAVASTPQSLTGMLASARTYLQLPLRQWGARNVYLLVGFPAER